MKTRMIVIFCVLSLSLGSITPCAAADAGAVTVDALLVRPICLVATVVGSVVFLISLPVAATSKSVKSTADALVVRPAHATFTRPLGDLDSLGDYSDP